MKILLTNHTLNEVGGTEKWTYAVAKELVRRNHDVTVFTFIKGWVSSRMPCEVTTDPPSEHFDLALINHNTCLGFLLSKGLNADLKVLTTHGPSHRLEIPTNGADLYVGVSKEIQARMAAEDFFMDVITNGVDLEEFKPTEDEEMVGYRSVLSMCKQGTANEIVEAACKVAGYHFDSLHYTDKPVWDVADKMRQSDIVVGCGRTTYEALACGKDVLLFDWRDPSKGPTGDGWVTQDNVDDLRQVNFSNRFHAHEWGIGEVAQALKDYVPQQPHWARYWAQENGDIRDKVDSYLELKPVGEMING